MSDVLNRLNETLNNRKLSDASESYVASLYQAGLNNILEKIGEEATETILAAKDYQDETGRQALINETSDLLFHTLVMLAHLNIPVDDVLAELERRMGTSGLKEKASRGQA